MKIYILPIRTKFQPASQVFHYPIHNCDYGVEQDFYEYLIKSSLTTNNPEQADWHYLPVYWTRWHLNHDYAKVGLSELQAEINRVVLDDSKTFTICQYDDGPVVNIGRSVQFLASRKSQYGIDIPLLSEPHKKPFFRTGKRHLASFAGRISTHPVRQHMADALKEREDIFISDGDKGSRYFVKTVMSSYIALCPRGYGGSSFRFFEAMQLGVVPFLIGDIDTRPFKKFINWGEISLYTNTMEVILCIIDSLTTEELLRIGQRCYVTYRDSIAYQKWCGFVIKELENVRK